MLKIYATSRLSLLIGFYSSRRSVHYRISLQEADLLYRMEQCMAKWEKKRVHRRT